jgi:glycosyltransferase involved in cell wall biosynthesis
VYERYFRFFDHYPKKDSLFFVLPREWEAKGGKIKASTPIRDDIKIVSTKALFFHSHYPIIKGLLKGWMPNSHRIIKQNAKRGDILYTAIEPNLLTTYFNAKFAKRNGMRHIFFTWQNVPYNQRLGGLKLKITEFIIRGTIKNSVGAICGNTKAAEILKKYTDAKFNILVAPIAGVDVDKFGGSYTDAYKRNNNLNDKVVVTFSGVFDKRKGIETLLNAFLISVRKRENLHLIMIGTGPLRNYIEDFINRHNLTNNTTLIDWLPNEELPAILSNSDIFIHPSEPSKGWEEQFGFSMAEASASGLPIISTDTGSIGEVVIDQKTGILVKPGDANRLSAAIDYLVDNPQKRMEMGADGRRYIGENFSDKAIAMKFYNFFSNVGVQNNG